MTDGDDDVPMMETHMAPELAGVRPDELRIAEALLFASREPLSTAQIARHLPPGTDAGDVLSRLQAEYAGGGVNIVRVGGRWAARTAGDLAVFLKHLSGPATRLSRAAVETLAVIAYEQPITRAEIEEMRGLTAVNLDVLLETGWVRARGRRKVPGRPLTYGTTEAFLSHFGLASLGELPTPPASDDPRIEAAVLAALYDGLAPESTLRAEEEPLDAGEEPLDAGDPKPSEPG